MRIEVREIKWFTLAELKEFDDGGRAFEAACGAIVTAMWESGSTGESVAETILYAFAQQIGEPTVEKHGVGDYPGVPGVTLDGWDLERGSFLALRGTLTRDNAPALPWDEHNDALIDHIDLRSVRDGTDVYVAESDAAWDVDVTVVRQSQDTLEQAVRDAIGAALSAGRLAAEDVEDEDYLLDLAEANEWEFTETGSWS